MKEKMKVKRKSSAQSVLNLAIVHISRRKAQKIFIFFNMHSRKLPFAFLKEEIEKQNRKSNFLHFETFRTNVHRKPIANKFWSKYDSKVEMLDEKHEDYMEKIEKSFTETPKSKYESPIIESHNYGWTPLFIKYDASDMELLYHPKESSDITRVGEKIAAEKSTERPKYNGIPFKLT